MDKEVVRELTWFDKESELLVGEAELLGLELTTLHHLFGQWPQDPLYSLDYPVGEPEIKELAKYLSSQTLIDLEHYDYFVSCHVRDHL
ncbi:MAG TPA: hypothetical protein VKR06_03625 [Ktedonosporobacter sp.]|nr:hypothetical protein [Ktedonosporobacter sp.]